MIILNFIEDGKQFGVIEIPENLWHLSEYKTYEQAYIAGHITPPGRTAFSYAIWLDRPLTKDRTK